MTAKPLGYKALLEIADAQVKAVSPQEAANWIGSASHCFVDIRDPRELSREGHLPGAHLAPRGMLEFWIDPESPYHKPLFARDVTFVFFCAGGWRSALAAKLAQDMGLKSVVHIEGGMSAWKKAGLAVEGGAPKP